MPKVELLFDKHALVGNCLRLPMTIDLPRLTHEIQSIPAEFWGEQRAIVHQSVDALFAKGYATAHRKPDEDRPVLARLPYLRSILYGLFPGAPGKCCIASLRPKSTVLMHRDGHVNDPEKDDTYWYSYFINTLRMHIPITTNEKVSFFCNGEFFHMAAGEVWTVNNSLDHAVINDHPTKERTHIIFDVHPVPQTLELIKKAERVPGWRDREALKRLMDTSESPRISPYSRGKPLPY